MSIAHASGPDLSPLSIDLDKKKRKKRHNDDSSRGQSKERKKRKETSSLSETDPPRKKKKEKTTRDPSIGLDVDVNSQASTASLLSTIVAAAAGTPDLPSQMAVANHDPQNYINYPPVQYGFAPNPQFAPPMNLSFSDLTFASNEDVLRALQDIDISKIANVLKTLEDAATAANVPLIPPPPMPSRAIPLGQMPAPSNAIIANASTDLSQGGSRCRISTQQTTPDHAHLLATKWLNAQKLSALVKTEGTPTQSCHHFAQSNTLFCRPSIQERQVFSYGRATIKGSNRELSRGILYILLLLDTANLTRLAGQRSI